MNTDSHDIISRIGSGLLNWIDGWGPGGIQFLVRAVLLYGLPLAFCFLAYHRGSRSPAIQAVCLVVGILLALTLSMDWVALHNATAKLWVAALCVVLLAFLPAVLPAYVAPTIGAQSRLRLVSYLVLIVLLIANLVLT